MTSTKPIFDIPDWNKLEGLTLEGGYELQEILAAETYSAVVRVRVLGDSTLKATAKFYRLAADVAQQQLAIWEELRSLRGSDALSVPLGSGTLSLDGLTVTYVVLAIPEEVLADGLRERRLSKEEAKQVLQAVLSGMEQLHANGFVHGRISPREIYAIRDSIQLSTEHVRRINVETPFENEPPEYMAPESNRQNITTSADVWCLGATLFEALTQRKYEPELRSEAGGLEPPFGAVAECCLTAEPELRCKPNGIPPLLERTAAVRAAESPRAPLPAIPRVEPIARPPQSDSVAEKPKPGGPAARVWLYIGAAAIVLLLIVWFSRSRPSAPNVTAVAPARPDSTATTPTPSVDKHAPTSSPTGAPSVPTAIPPHRAAAKRHPANNTSDPAIWRVIMFTYNREQDANNKARSINQKQPQIAAQVFQPNAEGPYLVTAGGQMTYSEAKEQRLNLIRSGMPHDTYIQNYKR